LEDLRGAERVADWRNTKKFRGKSSFAVITGIIFYHFRQKKYKVSLPCPSPDIQIMVQWQLMEKQTEKKKESFW